MTAPAPSKERKSPWHAIADAAKAAKAARAAAGPPLELPARRAPRRVGAKPRPLAKVDALLRIPLFAPRAEHRMFFDASKREDIGTFGHLSEAITPGRPAARTWREAAARFEKLGYTVIPVPDGRVTLASAGGRADAEAIDTFAKVAPWIAAGRAGNPWPCAWCPTEAATLLAGGVPACEEHAR